MRFNRFKILRRDGFRCRYCGATPDVSELHVDHVQPRSRGGTDDPLNLVTACSACNLSKGAQVPRWHDCEHWSRMESLDLESLLAQADWNTWQECTDPVTEKLDGPRFISRLFEFYRLFGEHGCGNERCFVVDATPVTYFHSASCSASEPHCRRAA